MAEAPSNIYPQFKVKNNIHPNKFLAFPLIGSLVRIILSIPVFIVLLVYSFAYFFFWIVIPFYILFTGKYWDAAYNFFLGYMKFYTKLDLYLYGLTDKYPGFALNDGGRFEFHIDKPTKPNRWLALPVIGFIIRIILLIPYIIYTSVLQNGSMYAVVASWFTVLFKGRYAESLYEFNRDTIRVSNASYIYSLYLSDKYPSFWISMDHQGVKIFLIILGAISSVPSPNPFHDEKQQAPYEINNENNQFDFEESIFKRS